MISILSKNQVQFYLSEMPKGSIEAFELGNEPDHYPKEKDASGSIRSR